jgi:predicted DsbA family dithiol-disulfide isomerase
VRIEKLRVKHDLTVKWTHFPLHPDTPTVGRTLADMFGASDDRVDQMQREMKERMAGEGLAYGDRSMTYNSRLAQEVGAWADSLDGDVGDRIHDAFFKAYFVDGVNIADRGVLIEIARSVGLPADEIEAVIDERRFGDAVDQDWDRSRRIGVTGVPTFVIGRQAVVGAQPYEILDRFAADALKSEA